ncbi:NACHT, LRR and PYD domains-containing protein 3-like [Diretmus argenteus]
MERPDRHVTRKRARPTTPPLVFEHEHHSTEQSRIHQERPDPPVPICESTWNPPNIKDEPQERPVPICESIKSESTWNPPDIKDEPQERPDPPVPICESIKSESTWNPPDIKDEPQERPDPPVPIILSIKSESLWNPPDIEDEPQERPDPPVPIILSIKSESTWNPPNIKDEPQERPDSSVPICVSMKTESDWSLDIDHNFRDGCHSTDQRVHQERSEVPSGQSAQEHQPDLASIFLMLEENIVTFVKKELKSFQMVLSPDYPGLQREDEEVDGEEEEQRKISREPLLEITLHFLRRLKQEELADSLQSRTTAAGCQRQLKSNLKQKFQCLFDTGTLLNQFYTERCITEGDSEEVNDKHEIRQIETVSRKPARPETTIKSEDLFKPLPGREEPVRTVMTRGVAGIGKTVLTQKFTLDWAEDQTNHNIHFMFPFTFRELNLLKGKKFSLLELLHHFFDTKEAEICNFDKSQVVLIFDGLDECRLPLDFRHNPICTNVTESTSVDVLLTNLIKGNLLPSARIWITTRPAAANQIPPECIDVVTEVRGFTDPQKEEFFRKRFTDQEQARKIFSHVKSSQSLRIMCHIPVFCQITNTVMNHVLTTNQSGAMPNTLTEMYTHFLVVQTKQANARYHGRAESDPLWTTENRKMILSLGKLAFEQLEKGNLLFYESDLTECGIDVREGSVYSDVFTQIFKEERGLYQDRMFCFVHLSVQEFLAAVYVFLSFSNTGVNLLSEEQLMSPPPQKLRKKSEKKNLYQSAVDKALQSPNGHLDLFLRFLLGLSLETNQILLRGLVKQTGSSSQTRHETLQYIKEKIWENPTVERSINLFHCLNELNDHSVVEKIQLFLRTGTLPTAKLSPGQWSALVFILLSSEEELEVFDLKKYSASEEGLFRLLPVIKSSRRAVLSGCQLSERSCQALASVVGSKSSSLRDLDMSNNDLQDSGVKLLSAGLRSPDCKLESLSLSGCLVSEEGCASLASALSSNPSHLRELDLSYNHPGDSGVKLLCAGLEDPDWRLERLSLSGCLVSEEGCASLASALRSNPSHLRERDLSYNHPGDSGVKLLCAGLEDPDWRLERLRCHFWQTCMLGTGRGPMAEVGPHRAALQPDLHTGGQKRPDGRALQPDLRTGGQKRSDGRGGSPPCGYAARPACWGLEEARLQRWVPSVQLCSQTCTLGTEGIQRQRDNGTDGARISQQSTAPLQPGQACQALP